MKKLLSCFFLLISASQLLAQNLAYIPDAQFRAYINSVSPAAMVGDSLNIKDPIITTLDSVNVSGLGITSLDGIEYFDSLHILEAAHNNISVVRDLPQRILFKADGKANFGYNRIDTLGNSINQSYRIFGVLNLNLSHNLLSGNYFFNNATQWISLDVSYNNLTSFVVPTSTLTRFDCSHNKIPILDLYGGGSALLYLDCSFNQIGALGPYTFPQLAYFDCSHNRLTQKPPLNTTLSFLNISSNQLLELDSLPAGLIELYCNDNNLVSLKGLPPSLAVLQCANNNLLCLPTLPNSLEQVQAAGNYIGCLPNIPISPLFNADVALNGSGYDVCSSSTVCNRRVNLSGYAFLDINGNGVKDTLEPPIANLLIDTKPYPLLLTTDNNGYYQFTGYAGLVYTIKPVQYGLYSPDSILAVQHNVLKDSTGFNFAFRTDSFSDMQVFLTQVIPAMAGQITQYQLKVLNAGNVLESGNVQFKFNTALFSLQSATPGYQPGAGILTWPYNTLYPGSALTFTIQLNTGANATLNDVYQLIAEVTTTHHDSFPLNNADTIQDVVVDSYQRNKKAVSPADYNSANLYAGNYLDYTITFQNTGTGAAGHVWIIDTISSFLNLNTLQIMDASHGYNVTISGNELRVDFYTINLPDSTNDQLLSHGFFRFRIKPRSLPSTGSLLNTAYIYFDGICAGGFSAGVNICFTPLSLQSIPMNVKTSFCGNRWGSASVSVNSGNPPYQYNWNTGDTVGGISPVSKGIYYVTVTDNCYTTGATSVTVDSIFDPQIVATATFTPISCAGNDGTATVTACGGSGQPLQYRWSNGATGNSLTGLAGGTYRCTISDGVLLGYAQTVSVSIPTYTPLTATIAKYDCSGGSNYLGRIVLSTSGGRSPKSYLWNTGQVTSSINNLINGTYTCTVTDAANCVVTVSASINSPGPIFFDSVVVYNTHCYPQAGRLSFSVSNNATLVKLDGQTLSSNHILNYDITAGWHTLSASTGSSCIKDTTFYVSPANNPPNFSIWSSAYVTCNGASDGNLEAFFWDSIPPNLVYGWSNFPPGLLQIDSVPAGVYSFFMRDSNNCFYYDEIIVEQPPATEIRVVPNTNPICAGDNGSINTAFQVGQAAGFTYEWSGPNGFHSSQQLEVFNNIQPNQAGVYTVTATNGCETLVESVNLVVDVSLPVFPLIESPDSSLCVGNTLQLNCIADNANTYAWSGPNSFNSSLQYPSLTNMQTYNAGVYTIVASNGCGSVTGNIEITVDENPAITIAANNTSVCANNAQVTFTANSVNAGNNAVYAWKLNALTVGVNASLLGPESVNNGDSVICSLTSDNGCVATVYSNTVYITINDVVQTPLAATICSGSAYWFKGVPLNQPGTYSDTLQTTNGCDSIVTLTLNVAPTLTESIARSICTGGSYSFKGLQLTEAGIYNDTLLANGGCDSIVILTLSVTNALYTTLADTICAGSSYSFNGNLIPLAGTYTDTLVSATGCDSIVTLQLSVNDLPAPVINRTADTLETQSFATYQWTFNDSSLNGANNQKLVITNNGNYAVVVTDAIGCINISNSFNVTGLAVNEISEQKSIQLYPNPNTGWFTIQFNDNQLHEVEITDAIGRIILPAFKTSGLVPVKLDKAMPGIYFAHCKQQNDAIRTLKFTVFK